MKLQLQQAAGQYMFTGYGDGYVAINREHYRSSLIVLPDRLILNWEATALEEMTAAHLERIAALRPEVVLLGTGTRQRFPPPSLTGNLGMLGIGLEVMDNFAVCRTYNILMGEGRRVAAALIIAREANR